jgi:hypothetical protein
VPCCWSHRAHTSDFRLRSRSTPDTPRGCELRSESRWTRDRGARPFAPERLPPLPSLLTLSPTRHSAAGPASKPRPKAPRVSADLDESAAADVVLSAVQQAAAAASAEEEAETAQFANYAPKFVKEGAPHPDPCVETSTLAAVAPPQPTYKHQCVPSAENLSRSCSAADLCAPAHN